MSIAGRRPSLFDDLSDWDRIHKRSNVRLIERLPEIAPEDALGVARRMCSLPCGRPDAPECWRHFGREVVLELLRVLAFIEGLLDAGRSEVVTAFAHGAIGASKALGDQP